MPKMYPSLANNFKYHGEKLIFEQIQKCSYLENFSVFHSLSILSHNKKPEGEADFVFVGPQGIFVLEVKGSSKIVANSDGLWEYFDGNKSYKKESPFLQAKNNLYSITKNIENNLTILVGGKRGYGVAFPKLDFDRRSIEWEKEIIIDSSGIEDFNSGIIRLINHWRKQSNLSDWDILTKEEISRISDYLRGEFIILESTMSFCDRTIQIINSISEEQLKSLEYIVAFRSVFINGLPGTGKTLLAKKIARSRAAAGERVLFLCYNRMLATDLKLELGMREKNITVMTIDSLTNGILNANLTKEHIPADILERRTKLRDLLQNSTITIDEYDYLIIDESQDFLDLQMLGILDRLVKNGLEGGCYAIFYDDAVQDALYGGKELGDTINQLTKITGNRPIKLNRNFRNPEEIIIKTNLFTKLPVPQCAIPSSPENVTISYYHNLSDQVKKIYTHICYLTQNQKIPLNRIIILTFNKQTDPLVNALDKLLSENGLGKTVDLSFLYEEEGKKSFELSKKELPFCTVHAFKGLESDIVIVAGIESLEDRQKVLLYIGMTRARVSTILVCKDNLSNIIKKETDNGK